MIRFLPVFANRLMTATAALAAWTRRPMPLPPGWVVVSMKDDWRMIFAEVPK